jgi:hypothetical protein
MGLLRLWKGVILAALSAASMPEKECEIHTGVDTKGVQEERETYTEGN